ncbi:DUF2971 domain-containing protein [Rhodococcus sp. NPDC127530]|uniref:DUF2971 domain-containing protein n=1 Tax=unclassified Rhodococcus (in: high G+C Gram-positive bacteria) TaxID=192944 RepID=UPI0036398F4C
MEDVPRTRSIALWATDARFLNDSAELRYAASALADRIRDGVPRNDSVVAARMDAFADKLRDGEFTGDGYEDGLPHTAYVTSFCREGDLLSQWRGYGANGGGYSIEFRTAALTALNIPWGRAGDDAVGYIGESSLHKVIYGLDDDLLEETAESIIDPGRYSSAMTTAVTALARFKNPAFEEEDEWRLIFGSGTYYMPCMYRTSVAGAVVPYVQLHRFHWDQPLDPFAVPSAIKSVTVGPGPDQGMRRESVLQLLRQRQFTDVTVRCSETPYRG